MIPQIKEKVLIPTNDNEQMTGDWVSKLLFNGWQPRLDKIKSSCLVHDFKDNKCTHCPKILN